MNFSKLFRQSARPPVTVVALVLLGACSTSPESKNTGLLGYGTPGVSSSTQDPPAATLQEELNRCSHVPQAGTASETQSPQAACSQLQRTVRNQPGNTVR